MTVSNRRKVPITTGSKPRFTTKEYATTKNEEPVSNKTYAQDD